MIQKILSRILVVVVLFGLTLDIEAQRKKKKKRNKGETEQIVKPKPNSSGTTEPNTMPKIVDICQIVQQVKPAPNRW